jgi:ParB family chromosome partitioning protein
MTDKPRRLGRGLEALLGSANPQVATDHPPVPADPTPWRRIPITSIRPNPYQPRRDFNAHELTDLESSIRTSGLLQPISVRPAGSNTFELIAGERRLRAATNIGWTEIPALIRELDDREMLTLALVENLQRADLNPIEAAEGYHRLIQEFALSQQQVADVVGKDRSTVANTLRLLSLPAAVRQMVQTARLTEGHGRALLAAPNESALLELARLAVAKQWTVRDTEREVRHHAASHTRKATQVTAPSPKTAEIRHITDALRRRLQTDVELHVGPKDRGDIRIAFYSAEDLERLLDLIIGPTREDM